jgi:hypothetical protein
MNLRTAWTLALLTLALIARGQDNVPDVPANHWIYVEIAILRKLHLLRGDESWNMLYRANRPPSRTEIAQAVSTTILDLDQSITSAIPPLGSDERHPWLERARKAMPPLPHLVHDFGKEIKVGKNSPPKLNRLVNRCQSRLAKERDR